MVESGEVSAHEYWHLIFLSFSALPVDLLMPSGSSEKTPSARANVPCLPEK